MKIKLKYIIFLVLTIIYIPLAISLYLTYKESFHEIKYEFEQSHSNILNGIKLNLLTEIEKIKLILNSLSQNPEIKRKNTEYCDKLFASLKKDCSLCLNILMADEKGNNIGSAVNPQEAHKLNYLDKEWFHNGFKGKFFINSPYISKLFKIKTFMITHPVFNGNRQIAVLGIPIDLVKMQELISKSYQVSKKTNIVIVNDKGIILYNLLYPHFVGGAVRTKAVNDLIFSGKKGSKEIIGYDGLKRIYIYDTIDELGWKVFVSIPPTELYSESFKRVKKQLYISVIFFSFSLVLAFFITGKFSKNTKILLNAFKELSEGKREIKSFSSMNCYEFNELFKELNNTTNSLISYENELKRLNSAYHLLSEVNQKIVRYENIENLLGEVCKDIIKIGGFDFALIGKYEKDIEREYIKIDSFYCSNKIKNEINEYDLKGGFLDSDFLLLLKKKESFIVLDKCYLLNNKDPLDLITYYNNINVGGNLYGLIIIGKKDIQSFFEREIFLFNELTGDIGFAINAFLTKKEKEKSDILLKSLFTNMGEGLILIDREKRIVMANKKYSEIVKKDYSLLIGRHCYESFYNFTKPCKDMGIECAADYVFANGNSQSKYYEIEDENGNKRIYLVRYEPLYEEDKIKYVVIIFNDLTDYKKLESQYLQAQKMESIGRLSAGIAHDFNNILTGIMGSATLAKMLEKDSKIQGYLDTIIELSDKAGNLTKSLLTFSRKQQISNPEVININEAILKMEKIISRVIGENISVKLNLTPRPLYVLIDPLQFEQIVMNLAVNAKDAISGDNGIFNISTELVNLSDSLIRKYGLMKEGYYALISFSDNGCGIPKDIIDKIFEPFFTTKEKGKGTGLGLSVVYGIVKSFDGFINVYSEAGKGTTFKIYFPIYTKNLEEIEKEDVKFEFKKLNLSILIVEDERSVIEVLKEVLETFGATVEFAEDGLSAYDILKKKDFDLVISDIIMPKMNGVELYNKVKELGKETPFLFVSGYPYDLLKENFLIDFDKVLQKPITPEKIYEKILYIIEKRTKV